ncbi:MAG: hypothetical protein IT287_03800 [Bdellovibrionaceae bacterium]|nr:hypothetical protein [Pseudobdellovibrionaceae bacterium]
MILLLLHIMTCAMMTGLIWLVQLVHYPAFAQIGDKDFLSFHMQHSQRITYIVGPTMLIELVTAVLLLLPKSESKFFWFNLTGVVLIWMSTALLSIPLHNTLATGKDLLIINKLVLTNWPRTILWSVRLCALIMYFYYCSGDADVRFR